MAQLSARRGDAALSLKMMDAFRAAREPHGEQEQEQQQSEQTAKEEKSSGYFGSGRHGRWEKYCLKDILAN